ncbi:hypothetical protein HNY73_017269 [Argiope bruennichi]|uniref:Uncharacterized protein n=1 Tax=Argiope bruennichi TaxID=94029 RepID=A0A8T0EL95_ARGBR|nr:hypothetical protein HNY73_017269 [Argiope bruennichi]
MVSASVEDGEFAFGSCLGSSNRKALMSANGKRRLSFVHNLLPLLTKKEIFLRRGAPMSRDARTLRPATRKSEDLNPTVKINYGAFSSAIWFWHYVHKTSGLKGISRTRFPKSGLISCWT